MSEKIYACLLRLYPSWFRESYGDEALQLFRDRLREEHAFPRRLRLWFDVFLDLAVSVPRQRGRAITEPVFAGFPAFGVLPDEWPRAEALVLGVILSVLTAVFFSIPQSNRHFPRISTAGGFRRAAVAQANARQTGNLNAVERQQVIRALAADLRQYYVDRATGQKTAGVLLRHQAQGDYDQIHDPAALAARVTAQIQETSQDRHLALIYSARPIPRSPLMTPPQPSAAYRQAMERDHCMFEKVEVLAHNIGYIKLNFFPDPSVCASTAKDVMASINNTDAVIFDLRDNRGGIPGMVALIAAYLFDHPVYFYNPRENTTRQSWTASPVAGNHLADRPVYVLTSHTTLSGAEHFTWNLKMLKRATIVGETTGGAAHAGVFHRINDHFGIAITETQPVNPYSENDWEGTGVAPDVKMKSADALDTAERLAALRLQPVASRAHPDNAAGNP